MQRLHNMKYIIMVMSSSSNVMCDIVQMLHYASVNM